MFVICKNFGKRDGIYIFSVTARGKTLMRMRVRRERNQSGWEYCTFVCGRQYEPDHNRDLFVGHGNYVNYSSMAMFC
jgi:hypothetical protein